MGRITSSTYGCATTPTLLGGVATSSRGKATFKSLPRPGGDLDAGGACSRDATTRDTLAPGMELNDTHPQVAAFLREGYRRMSVSEKLARVCALTRAVQELGLVDVRRAHPNADDRELALRLASRRLDPATMRRAFGWDPSVQGY